MTDREMEREEEAAKIVAETHELAQQPETVTLSSGKKRKKRSLNLSKEQKRQIRYLRTADRVGIIFGEDNIKVSRADAIRLVEKSKARVLVNMTEEDDVQRVFVTVLPPKTPQVQGPVSQ